MLVRTYPHDVIKEECKKALIDKWSLYECIVNSLLLYYGKITKEELIKKGEKFVEI